MTFSHPDHIEETRYCSRGGGVGVVLGWLGLGVLPIEPKGESQSSVHA
jgi:hypothetical protein